MNRVRFGRGPNKLLWPSGTRCPPGTLLDVNTQSATNQGSSPSSGVCSFLLRLHRMGTSDWIIGHTAEYNSQPSCLSWRLGWCHVAPNPNPLGRCMVFLGWPVPILSHLVSINSQVWSQGPSINKWRSSLRKFQGLRGYLPEMGDKGQTDFLLHTSLVRDMGKS